MRFFMSVIVVLSYLIGTARAEEQWSSFSVTPARTDSGIPWGELVLPQKILLVGAFGLSAHQAHLSLTHELTHFGVAKALKLEATLHPLPEWVGVENGQMLTASRVEFTRQPNGTKALLVAIAPVFTRVLLDRGIAGLYRSGHISPGTFGDRWMLASMQYSIFDSFGEVFIPSGDMGVAAKAIGLKPEWLTRVVLTSLAQTAYVLSYLEVLRARGDDKPVYAMYFHISF